MSLFQSDYTNKFMTRISSAFKKKQIFFFLLVVLILFCGSQLLLKLNIRKLILSSSIQK